MARKPAFDPEIDDDFTDPPPATADDRPKAKRDTKADVGKSVGENRPTPVGRKNPTNTPTNGGSIFGVDRKHNLHGRKLHPQQESGQKNLTLRKYLLEAIELLADREGLSKQPGKVADYLLEYALTELSPETLAEAYQDRCNELGVPNDRK